MKNLQKLTAKCTQKWTYKRAQSEPKIYTIKIATAAAGRPFVKKMKHDGATAI